MRPAAAIIGAIAAATVSAGLYQFLWHVIVDPSGTGFLSQLGTIFVGLGGAILGGLGAACPIPARAWFGLVGLFVLLVLIDVGHYCVPGKPPSYIGATRVDFLLGSFLIGRGIGWLMGVRKPDRLADKAASNGQGCPRNFLRR